MDISFDRASGRLRAIAEGRGTVTEDHVKPSPPRSSRNGGKSLVLLPSIPDLRSGWRSAQFSVSFKQTWIICGVSVQI